MLRSEIKDYIANTKADTEAIADKIWEYAELSFEEVKSAKAQADYLESKGFKIKMPVSGMKSGLVAEWGEGKPVLAFAGEFDALYGLNQTADVAEACPYDPGKPGHGCGHNLFGTGCVEAVVAVQEYMKAHNLKGTIRYYGCPAEEGGGGKVYMVLDGQFKDVDAVFSWHPYHFWDVTQKGRAIASVYFEWEGVTAHAMHAEQGRSALDALELMNMGYNMLRKLVEEDTRMGYSIINSGGKAANIISDHTVGLYQFRHPSQAYLMDVFNRVCDLAKGAAIMTGTKLKGPYIASNYSNYLENTTLNNVTLNNIKELLPLPYTEEELEYGRKFASVGANPGFKEPFAADVSVGREIIHSDVADVSWAAPLTHFFGVTLADGTKPHNWGTTAQGKSKSAKRGMHAAAEIMANSALDVLENPDILAAAKKEYEERIASNPPYESLQSQCTPDKYLEYSKL